MGSHFWFSEPEEASHLEIGSESEVHPLSFRACRRITDGQVGFQKPL